MPKTPVVVRGNVNKPKNTRYMQAMKRIDERAEVLYSTVCSTKFAGKTVFTQGFAAGLGVKEYVNSPTFTVVQEYLDGRMPFYHFDVYRIGYLEEMDEIGYEDYFYGQGVCLIEWADQISELIPEDAIKIWIIKEPGKGFDYRLINISY